MKFSYLNNTYTVKKVKNDKELKIIIGDKNVFKIKEVVTYPNLISFRANGKLHHVYFAITKNKQYYHVDGEDFTLESTKSKTKKAKAKQKGNTVFSQMPGLLVKIPVKIGEKVSSGTTLAIVESMKMQNELPAPCDGIVKKINFKEGEQVDAKQDIVELEK